MEQGAMLSGEIWEWLRTEVRAGAPSTVRPDGRPHLAPVWWVVDGESLVFTTWATSVKGKNIAGRPDVAILVQDDQPPYTYVVIEGRATIEEDLQQVARFAAALGARFMGAERAEEFGARNGVPGEVLVRVVPTALHGVRHVAEA